MKKLILKSSQGNFLQDILIDDVRFNGYSGKIEVPEYVELKHDLIEESRKVEFKLNSKNLQLQPKEAVDMENPDKKDITFDGSKVTLAIPRHDYRVILFK